MSNKTKKCPINDFRPAVLSQIRRYIAADESILACYETDHDSLMGGLFTGKDIYTYSQVLTENQIVQVMQHKGTESINSMRLVDISDIAESGGNSDYRVIVTGQGESVIQFFFSTQKMSQEFSDILRGAIEQTRKRSVGFASDQAYKVEMLELIEKLSQLKKSGAITEEEFQIKKGELLRRI